MAEFSGIPRWIQIAKVKAQRSDEWSKFSKVLYDVVNALMRENGIRSFSVLSPSEKKMLLMKAANTLKDNSSYRNMLAVVSLNLDQELSSKIQIPATDKAFQNLSTNERISEECHYGLESILTKWPETNCHLSRCINTSLNPKLRYTLWKTKLQNDKVRKMYLRLVEASPKQLASKFDLEISQKCQSLLQSDSSLRSVQSFNSAPVVLRHVLSYHHVASKTESSPSDIEYLLAVPFVYCTLSRFLLALQSKKPEPLTPEALAILIEQFELFWESRPDYAKSTEPGRSLNALAAQVLNLLRGMNASFVACIVDLFSKTFQITHDSGSRAISSILQPILRSFFVSYLPLNTVMFIWDQIFVGYDVNEYDPSAYICAVLLYLAKEDMQGHSTWRALVNALVSRLKTVKVEQLQRLMAEYKYSVKLKEILKQHNASNRQYPIPSTAIMESLPPWMSWHSDKLVTHYTRKRDSKLSNRTIAPHSVFLSAHSKEGPTDQSLNDLQLERDNLVEELHLMKDELEEARQQIMDEQMTASELRHRADGEFERLRLKLEYLQRQSRPRQYPRSDAARFGLTEPEFEGSETSSVFAHPTPPPSVGRRSKTPDVATPTQSRPESLQSNRAIHEENRAASSSSRTEQKKKVAMTTMKDLIRRTMQGAQGIAHGVGVDEETLNAQTKSDLSSVKQAYEQAKLAVFGKPTADEEIESMPDGQKQIVLSRISEATKRQLSKLK